MKKFLIIAVFLLLSKVSFSQMPKIYFENDTINSKILTKVVSVNRLPKYEYEFSHCVRILLHNLQFGEKKLDYLVNVSKFVTNNGDDFEKGFDKFVSYRQ